MTINCEFSLSHFRDCNVLHDECICKCMQKFFVLKELAQQESKIKGIIILYALATSLLGIFNRLQVMCSII